MMFYMPEFIKLGHTIIRPQSIGYFSINEDGTSTVRVDGNGQYLDKEQTRALRLFFERAALAVGMVDDLMPDTHREGHP